MVVRHPGWSIAQDGWSTTWSVTQGRIEPCQVTQDEGRHTWWTLMNVNRPGWSVTQDGQSPRMVSHPGFG